MGSHIRSAIRVGAADEQLHYALSAHDSSEGRTRQVLERQIRALVTVTGQLDKTAQYTLGTIQGRSILFADLYKLAVAAEHLQKGPASEENRPQLRKDWTAVTQAWERAIRGLQELKPQEHIYLLRSANQVDRLHERLFRLLGGEGERPRLIIRT